MTFFADPAAFPTPPDGLFLGADPKKLRSTGVPLERHALTIAGAGSGKGACLLIPNARRWRDNLLAVDPKGENAEATWQAREALGQSVHVLDPFQAANVPDRLRGAFNPLASIRVDSPTGREDCEVVADGLVKRSDPKHEEWYDGAGALLSGIIAYVVETAPPEHRTLAAVRGVLVQSDEALAEDAERMQQCTAFGGLAREAGLTITVALGSAKGMEKDFLSSARRFTRWLDSPQIAATLARSTFNLADLKQGRASVYLVLPPKYLDTHAAFLRLFVRSAIEAMMTDGLNNGSRCLFLLDEFFSLGRLDIVAKSAGLMRAYRLHLWPFLQDIGQLRSLYGDAADTFFANADAAVFFGNADLPTLEYVSRKIGAVDPREIGEAPTMGSGINPITGATVGAMFGQSRNQHTRVAGALIGGAVGAVGAALNDLQTRAQQAEMNEYQQKAMKVGRARLAPEEVQALTGKAQGATVAPGMLAFLRAGEVLHLRPVAYFDERLRKFTDLSERLQSRKAEAKVKPPAPRMAGALDLVAGLIGFLLLGSVAGPLSQPATVPAETWPALYAMWGGGAAIIAALVLWRRKIMKAHKG